MTGTGGDRGGPVVGTSANAAATREQALSLHRAGQLQAARLAYEAMLRVEPDDPDLLGLLGILWFQNGDSRKAEEFLRASLARRSDPRVRLRNLNSLVVLLRDTGRMAETAKLLEDEEIAWPQGVPPDNRERTTVLSLVEALILHDRKAKARLLLNQALPDRSGDAAALNLDGRLRLDDGDVEEARKILSRVTTLAPDYLQPFIALAYAQTQSGRPDEARATLQHVARTWPVHSAQAVPSHRATILVLNRTPRSVRQLNGGLRGLHYAFNYPSEIAEKLKSEYRFISLFGDLPTDDLPKEIPPADLVLNNFANAEGMNIPGRLERVRAAVERIGRPVINHPDHVARTTRQQLGILLAGVSNLRIPRIARYSSELAPAEVIAEDIEAYIGFPAIIRLCAAHESSGNSASDDKGVAVLVRGREALREHLRRSAWPEYYAIEFIDLRRDDGFYRKMRAAVVDREIILTQAAMSWQWLVSGGRRNPEGIAFYRANPQLHEECRRIVSDPGAQLGGSVMRTLEHMRDRIPLDLFGIDFDVDREGRVVVFEASAAMILLSTFERVPVDIRLPPEPRHRVNDAFRRMVVSRLRAHPSDRTD